MRSFLLRSDGLESTARWISARALLVGAITLRVAILLDQHQDVVDVDLDRGEIPSRRFGRRIVVFRHELERMFGASGAPTVQMDIEAGTMNSTG